MSVVAECRVCGADLTAGNWYPSFKIRRQHICNTCAVAQRKDKRLKGRIEFRNPLANRYEFQCRVCNSELTHTNWGASAKKQNNRICVECARRYAQHRSGHTPLGVNKECPLYLGVYVAERVLSMVFKDVHRMPMNNPGYDFICNRGKKIDVKSSCKNKRGNWTFSIAHNIFTDYFLCLAFDNRDNLTPLNMWLIPGAEVSNKSVISIRDISKNKWMAYQSSIDNVVACCEEIQS